MLGKKNHFDISDSIEVREVDIVGVACNLKQYFHTGMTVITTKKKTHRKQSAKLLYCRNNFNIYSPILLYVLGYIRIFSNASFMPGFQNRSPRCQFKRKLGVS